MGQLQTETEPRTHCSAHSDMHAEPVRLGIRAARVQRIRRALSAETKPLQASAPPRLPVWR